MRTAIVLIFVAEPGGPRRVLVWLVFLVMMEKEEKEQFVEQFFEGEILDEHFFTPFDA